MVYSGKEYDKIKKFILENRNSLCDMCRYKEYCHREFDNACVRAGDIDVYNLYDIDKVAEYMSYQSEYESGINK